MNPGTPKPGTAFKCGHFRTPGNSKPVRNGMGIACRECFKAHNREYVRKRRAAARAAIASAKS